MTVSAPAATMAADNDKSANGETKLTGRLGARAGTKITLSIDAMGGDRGPKTVVSGLARSARKNPDLHFILHGDGPELERLVARKRNLADRVVINDVKGTVAMDEKPSHALRRTGTSMRAAVDAVKNGEAQACVSCGNTGALMAISMIRLRKLEGINRPAIACLWPSRNSLGFNVMLDVGADIRADARDLLQYAMMGASYARNGLGLEHPRIGLLNVGTEEHKGSQILHDAHDDIAGAEQLGDYEFKGYVEGSDIPGDKVDVIVTDGYTGNIALKTGEGTAKLVGDFLRDAFLATPLSRIAALLAYTSMRRLRKRIDPRRVNGGVFLGLRGTVVKSHGSADALGMSAAIKLAYELAASEFAERVAARVASTTQAAQTGETAAK